MSFKKRPSLRLSKEKIQIQGDAWIGEHCCESFDEAVGPTITLPDGKVARFGTGFDDSSYSSGPYLDRGIRCNGCGATWKASNRKETP